MSKILVICESPGKIKKLQSILGSQYRVAASYGHLRDLPEDRMAVDLTTWEPEYQVTNERALQGLIKQARGCQVYLAMDDDREGEGIARGIQEEMHLPLSTTRVIFQSITKRDVKDAIARGGVIRSDLADAQQARRILDRLFGYTVSSWVSRSVPDAKSAGRVQSPAVRLVLERDLERAKAIESAAENSYYLVSAVVARVGKEDETLETNLWCIDTPDRVAHVKKPKRYLTKQIGGIHQISELETKPKRTSPPPPLTTLAMQKGAQQLIRLAPAQSMAICQKLYETGWITYHRTDTTWLSDDAMDQIRSTIVTEWGKRYYCARNQGEAGAHEAIRPTQISRNPYASQFEPPGNWSSETRRLYQMIWSTAVASQMIPSIHQVQTLKIPVSGSRYLKAQDSVLEEPGYLLAHWQEGRRSDDLESLRMDRWKVGRSIQIISMVAKIHYPTGPPHYTQASLLTALDKHGIGRPSTYASIMSTILARKYVVSEKPDLSQADHLVPVQYQIDLPNRELTKSTASAPRAKKSNDPVLQITDLGQACIQYLLDHCPALIDYQFTAQMETELDQISEGSIGWKDVVSRYYQQICSLVPLGMAQLGNAGQVVGQLAEMDLELRSGKFGEYLVCGPHRWSLGEESRDTIESVSALPAYQWKEGRLVWRAVETTGKYGLYLDVRKHAPDNKNQKLVRAADHRCNMVVGNLSLDKAKELSQTRRAQITSIAKSKKGARAKKTK